MSLSERAQRLKAATKADVFQLVSKEVYMGNNWGLYLPVWAVELLFSLYGSSTTHVVTIPEAEAGAIYIRGARKDEEGALELNFNETRTAAWVSIYWAAARFNKKPLKGRRLRIPLGAHDDPDLGKVLKLDLEAARIVKGNAEDSVAPEVAPGGPVEQTAAGRQDHPAGG